MIAARKEELTHEKKHLRRTVAANAGSRQRLVEQTARYFYEREEEILNAPAKGLLREPSS